MKRSQGYQAKTLSSNSKRDAQNWQDDSGGLPALGNLKLNPI
jgi:hypothetical protein